MNKHVINEIVTVCYIFVFPNLLKVYPVIISKSWLPLRDEISIAGSPGHSVYVGHLDINYITPRTSRYEHRFIDN